MEKSKRERSVLSEAAELFDLPGDAVAGLPHVELVGNRHFYMAHHRGIISYSGEEIAINGDRLILKVKGKNLELQSMSGEALRIRGTIESVEWVG